MAHGTAVYYSYLPEEKHLDERRFWCPVLDVAVILSFMYADKEIKAPWGGIKHVRAGSCTSITADKCFVQLLGSQIATLRDRRAVRRKAEKVAGCRDGRGTRGGRDWEETPDRASSG